MLSEWARFVVAQSGGAAANFLVYSTLINFAPYPFSLPSAALVNGVLMGLVFNFTLSKKYVFQ
jgi:hypothetical protein